MTAIHAAMRLGGPWRRIANSIQAGNTTIPLIKANLEPFRRRGVGRNCAVMVRLGLLIEDDGVFSLSPKCIAEMHPQ